MAKILEYHQEARRKILDGVEKLTKTVAVTMGPMGLNVIIGRSVGAPSTTKDGVSVAREVVLADPLEELGCQLVKEAAGRTAAVAGDGTTSATVLTHAIFKGGFELINSGYSPLHFRNGVSWVKNKILEELSEIAMPIEDEQSLIDIATISANNDPELGKIIAAAYSMVGNDGLITVEAAPNQKSEIRMVEGIELNTGYFPQFLEKGQSKIEMEDLIILICNWEIGTASDTDFQKTMTQVAQLKKPILLLCKDLKKEGLAFLVGNHQAGRLNICPVKIPKYTRHKQKWLEDLSALTGATIFGGDDGVPISEFQEKDLGFAKKIIVDSFKTKIFEASKNVKLVEEKIRLYRESISHLIGDLDRKDINERIGFLSSKVAVITVGYTTELELRERGDRVEDSIYAVKAALDEGYLVGGGFALYRVSKLIREKYLKEPSDSIKNWIPAIEVVLNACEVPANQIILNSGNEPKEILSKLIENTDINFGYNTASGEYGNLISMGIIDPKKVTRVVLENAVSISLLLINTGAIIADDPKAPSGWQVPAGLRLPDDSKLNHKH